MKKVYENKVGGAAVLMIFCIFAMSALTALLLGADAYRNITEMPQQGYDERICLSYVWAKVKSGDEAGRVRVDDFHGHPAIFIDEELGGALHHTAIYHYDGWIYELFFEDGFDFSPRDGDRVVKNETFVPEQFENGLIQVTAGTETMYIFPRGETGAAAPERGTAI